MSSSTAAVSLVCECLLTCMKHGHAKHGAQYTSLTLVCFMQAVSIKLKVLMAEASQSCQPVLALLRYHYLDGPHILQTDM